MKFANLLEAIIAFPSIVLIEIVDLWKQEKELALNGEFEEEGETEQEQTPLQQP